MSYPAHKQWEPYRQALQLAKEVYQITEQFPDGERMVLVFALRRLTIQLCQHIAAAAVKKGKKREQLLKECLDTCIAIDTHFEVALAVNIIAEDTSTEATRHLDGLYKNIAAYIPPK